MNGYSCRIRNLQRETLSGFLSEKDAQTAGGHYLAPDGEGWLDVSGLSGLCVVCENCGSVVAEPPESEELTCPDCGELSFRVFQTFRLTPIVKGFAVRWMGPGLKVAIDIPDEARIGMLGIRYTLDGSEPTLSSPAYTQPIPYSKKFAPLRAAVFYPDARSQIIEWDYGRSERKRQKIRKESNPRSSGDSSREKPKPPPVSEPSGGKPEPKPGKSSPPGTSGEKEGCLRFWRWALAIAGVVLIFNGHFGWGVAFVASAFCMLRKV